MKKCFNKIIIACISFMLTFCTVYTFLGSNLQHNISQVEAQTTAPLIAYCQGIDYIRVGFAYDLNGDGMIDMNESSNSVTTLGTKSAKFTVATRDHTAIAEYGDYTAIEPTEFTLTGTTFYKLFKMEIAFNSVGINDARRYFYFEILNIESDNMIEGVDYIIGSQKSIKQYDKCSYQFNTEEHLVTDSSGFDSSFDREHISLTGQNKTIKTSFNDPGQETFIIGSTQFLLTDEIAKQIINTNMAEPYVFIEGNIKEPSAIFVQNKNVNLSLYTTVFEDGYNVMSDNYVKWTVKFESDETEKADPSQGENLEVSGSFKANQEKTGSFQNFVDVDERYYFNLMNGDECITDMTFKIDNKGDYHRDFNIRIGARFINTKPTIKGYKIYPQVRVDETGREYIGMAIRFSEPMQLKRDMVYNIDTKYANPYISAWVNNASLSSVQFNYVEGSGTNTLYFEADVSNIKSEIRFVELKNLYNADVIVDYPVQYGDEDSLMRDMDFAIALKDTCVWGAEVDANIDLRVPSVAFEGTETTAIQQTHKVRIRTTNASDEATVYYEWSESELAPDNYTYSTPVVSTGAQLITSPYGITGKRYLHVKVVSEYQKESGDICRGPFNFDNSAPDINIVEQSSVSFKEKQFNITITDSAENSQGVSSGLKSVYAYISTNKDGTDAQEILINNVKDGEQFTYTIKGEDLGLAVGGDKEYGTYYIAFSAIDNVGNITDKIFKEYDFDLRDFFNSQLDSNGKINLSILVGENNTTQLSNILGNYCTAIDLSVDNLINFTTTDTAVSLAIGKFVKSNQFEDVDVDANTYSIATINSNQIQIEFNEDFKSGLYKIVLVDKQDSSTKVSHEYSIYITRGYQEDTGIYTEASQGKILRNYVYQLPAESKIYYMDSDGMQAQSYYYGNSKKPATFSSQSVAEEYIRFLELQDLYLIRLDQDMADDLNSDNVANFKKAINEPEAKSGQYWIRYKDVSWSSSSNSSTFKWVYYYYSDDVSVLRIEDFSTSLSQAINSVVKYILGQGGHIYLVEGDNIDANGSPYLLNEQLHISYQSVSQTRCGTNFEDAIIYYGDENIYSIPDISTPVISNSIKCGRYTKLFYKVSSESNIYKAIDINEQESLLSKLEDSGKYQILELDENGIKIYYIYVDCSAPVLEVSWYDSNGYTQNRKFSTSNNNQLIYGTNFTIKSIDSEYDNFAYVSIQGKGLSVYLKEYFNNQSISLTDGKYNIKVADRLGNSYAFTLQLDSSELVCSVKETKNSHIIINCNRSAEQIDRYEVWLDGELISTDFTYNDRRFYNSGKYRIYISDIYGNVFDEYYVAYKYQLNDDGTLKLDSNGNRIPILDQDGNKILDTDINGNVKEDYYHFKRDLPNVTWKYYNDGNYEEYIDNQSEKIKITKINEGEYSIYSSTFLQFSKDSNFGYEFLSGDVDCKESSLFGYQLITINELTSFTLKIYYTKHPTVFTIYRCVIDNIAPNITVSYNSVLYEMGEFTELNLNNSNGLYQDSDEFIFNPTNISYSEKSKNISYVKNGENVNSKYLKLSASDENGIKELNVYVNDELISNITSNFSNIVLNRVGHYHIEAVDKYDNISTFEFYNEHNDFVNYLVDDKAQNLDYSSLDYFEDGKYKKIDYASSSASIEILQNSKLYYVISNSKGEEFYIAFSVYDGKVSQIDYYIVVNNSIIETVDIIQHTPIITTSDTDKTEGKFYQIATSNVLNISIYVSFKNNNFTFKINSHNNENEIITVKSRVECNNHEPYYFETKLSKIKSNISFVVGDKIVDCDNGILQVNKPFKVDSNLDDNISLIKVAYSLTGDYKEYNIIFDGSINDITLSDEGLYHIQVINRFGNISNYYITLSSSFIVTAYVEYIDNTVVEYSLFYGADEIYSNHKVVIKAYSKQAQVFINDTIYSADVSAEGTASVIIQDDGEYNVKIIDEYGNVYTKKIIIQLNNLLVDDDVFYGHNQLALKADEGYSNNKISINSQKIQQADIRYISILYNNKQNVLYDIISEKKIELNSDTLYHSIGKYGDGIYTVIIRDKFGNKFEKVFNYCGTPTFEITRTLRNGLTENYSIEKALNTGVWSNNVVTFKTNAIEYILQVDDKENVFKIDYATAVKDTFEVEYIDEYGFNYKFTTYLLRQDVEVGLNTSINSMLIDDTLITNNNLIIDYSSNAECTYTINGGELQNYTKGQVLTKDGIYKFTATDLAGNIATFTIKKDTFIEYQFIDTTTEKPLINGGVTSSKKVEFMAINKDTTYIKKVYLNNEYLPNYNDDEFTQRGKWEFIVADKAGNETYFKFYILYGNLSSFEYYAPYEYVITEAYVNDGDGILNLATEIIIDNGSKLYATENGYYTISMKSTLTGRSLSFNFQIDNTPPQVSLVGCENGEKTINKVTISGCEIGDTIYIYKNNKLTKTIYVDSSTFTLPEIEDGGKYKITVENEAGVKTDLFFEKTHVPNMAGSILIIVVIIALVIALMVGLTWRNHSKTDE